MSQWHDIRTSLEDTVERFARVLHSVTDPSRLAVGQWTVADTAAHVREVATLNSTWATGGVPPSEYREAYEMAATAAVDEVSDVNALALANAPERDLHALAPLIQERVELMLYLTDQAEGSELVSWLGGLKLPVSAVLAHTLSELLVHGRDIARADGSAFPITADQARLVFEGFLVPLLTASEAARFGGERSEAMKPVTCELRLRGCAPVLLVADQDAVAIEEPGSKPVDVHVAADPAVMWLLMFNRVKPFGPALRGQVRVWGRRPWRLRRLVRLLQTP
ncbi:MAG: hypothetical protein JO176_03220 [Acidimicrobiia bacterium]|nr:hypothetical protein [Acidimicrobiia bacterium]